MIHYFYKYLIIHKQANLPGIGNFFIKRIPASVQSASNTITPPVIQIVFDKKEGLADKHFYTFLENEIAEENVNAIRKFNDFTYSLKEELQDKRKIWLPYLGELSILESGELVFNEEKSGVDYYPTVRIDKKPPATPKIEKVIQPIVEKVKKAVPPITVINATEKIEKKNANWWKIALGIAAASIIGILYYYATNNFQ